MNTSGLKTISGILITIAPLVATMFGYDTSPDFSGDASELISAGVVLVGSALALYGRAVAKAPLWFVKKD